MKNIFYILFISILFFSCTEDDNNSSSEDCTICESIVGKRWYISTDRDSFGDGCEYFEDIIFNSDGSVDVWRIGSDSLSIPYNNFIEEVADWDIMNSDNCIIRFSGLDSVKYTLYDYDCSTSISLLNDIAVVIHDKDCDSFISGFFTFFDFEP